MPTYFRSRPTSRNTRIRSAIKLSGFDAETIRGSRPENVKASREPKSSRFLILYWIHAFSKHNSVSEETMHGLYRLISREGLLLHSLTARPRIEPKRPRAVPERLPVVKTLESGTGCEFQWADKQPHARKFEPGKYRAKWLATSEPIAQAELARQYGISQLEGLKIVGDTWANPVPLAAVFERIEFLVETSLACTLEIAHSERWQVHTGQLLQMDLENGELKLSGADWASLTPLSEIESAWLVGNPASGRMEYAIEFFDRAGRMIIRFSEAPESLESAIWQDLLGTLPTLS